MPFMFVIRFESVRFATDGLSALRTHNLFATIPYLALLSIVTHFS